ncbi:hypothetical protein PUN28_005955 [Cardiocondyla obscurior]|uniref:Uncharacterized protein n=1 Tax=Cardiocondyla obscurior TaxID=286306 RepID=A0AAW2G821_9HYME
MSGFQVGTCPPDSHGPKCSQAQRKGRTGADLRKEQGEEMGCSVPCMHFAPNPRRIQCECRGDGALTRTTIQTPGYLETREMGLKRA